jgi:hypothetical protein
MDDTGGWAGIDPSALAGLGDVWIPCGVPGYAGDAKARWGAILDGRFGSDGWRMAHIVRGEVVSRADAIVEYEAAYDHFLRARPALVAFLTTVCGNVYDDNVGNVHDDDYEQPHTAMNHYQDISVRRVIAALVDDPAWPDVVPTDTGPTDLIDIGTGQTHLLPRANGFRGDRLLQIRDPLSPGYCLNPAVVPVHDPALIMSLPNRTDWYHSEGCAHLSVEAFWQMSKVVEVRYDRFLALGADRTEPLAGL